MATQIYNHAKPIETHTPVGYDVATHHRLKQTEFTDEKTWLKYKCEIHLPYCIRELQQRIDDYKQRIVEIENPELAEKTKFANQLKRDIAKSGMKPEQYMKHIATLIANA